MIYYMAAECKVSIIGGGFKPPHLGHLTMIFGGVFENNITVLAVGCGNRDGITRQLSKDILKVYLDDLKHQEILEYEETLFGFIILNKKDGTDSIIKVYKHLQSVLMGVSPEELLDSLIMDELHIETIQSLIDHLTRESGPKNEFIDKKSKSPIGLTFYLFQILEEYVKVDETIQLSLHYYVGDKDVGARQKIFSKFERKKNPRFQTHPVTSAGGGISGTETRKLLKDIVEKDEDDAEDQFSEILFKPLINNSIAVYTFTKSVPETSSKFGKNINTVTKSVMVSMKKKGTTEDSSRVDRKVSMWIRKAKEMIETRKKNVSSTILRALDGKIYASNRGLDNLIPETTMSSDGDIYTYLLGEKKDPSEDEVP